MTHKGDRKYIVSHFVVRLVAVAGVVYFVAGSYSNRFYNATRFADADLDLIVMLLLAASTFILPLFVGLEFLWARADRALPFFRSQRNPILVDGLFALLFFAVVWGLSLYGLFHHVWL
jgi:hypothetical protein